MRGLYITYTETTLSFINYFNQANQSFISFNRWDSLAALKQGLSLGTKCQLIWSFDFNAQKGKTFEQLFDDDTIRPHIYYLVPPNDKVIHSEALHMGADELVATSTPPELFLHQVSKGQMKKPEISHAPLCFGSICVDDNKYKVSANGRNIELTISEFKLLKQLVEYQGRPLRRRELSEVIHGRHMGQYIRGIDSHIASLRKKLGSEGQLIKTVRGVGYAMDSNEQSAICC